MIDLLLAVRATLWASFGGEVLREWVTIYQAFQQAATPQQDDWMAYYKDIKGVLFSTKRDLAPAPSICLRICNGQSRTPS